MGSLNASCSGFSSLLCLWHRLKHGSHEQLMASRGFAWAQSHLASGGLELALGGAQEIAQPLVSLGQPSLQQADLPGAARLTTTSRSKCAAAAPRDSKCITYREVLHARLCAAPLQNGSETAARPNA